MNILILCTGNSCRSQMAHGILQSLDSRLRVCSAGTRPAPRVHPEAVAAMRELGIELSGRVPLSVDRYRDEAWDYVITVCGGARESCPAFTGRVGKRLHLSFDDPAEATGSSDVIAAAFRRVRDEIRRAFTALYRDELLPQLSPGEPDAPAS